MVLRFSISDAPHLKQAIQAVPVSESKNVVLIWCPDYFAVLSFLQHSLPDGENPSTFLKLRPQSFITYECTDQLFNAVLKIDDLEHVFTSARNLDVLLFSHSLGVDNGVNNLGFLYAQFQKPLVPAVGGGPSGEGYTVPMKIYGNFPGSRAIYADLTQDLSRNPLPPVATFRPIVFGRVMSSLKLKGMPAVAVVVHKEEAFFSAVPAAAEGEGGGVRFQLSLTAENGLVWTRGDVGSSPVLFEFPTANLEVGPGSKLSTEVSLYKRSETVKLIWFKLDTDATFLRGDLIHYFY